MRRIITNILQEGVGNEYNSLFNQSISIIEITFLEKFIQSDKWEFSIAMYAELNLAWLDPQPRYAIPLSTFSLQKQSRLCEDDYDASRGQLCGIQGFLVDKPLKFLVRVLYFFQLRWAGIVLCFEEKALYVLASNWPSSLFWSSLQKNVISTSLLCSVSSLVSAGLVIQRWGVQILYGAILCNLIIIFFKQWTMYRVFHKKGPLFKKLYLQEY